MLVSTNDLNEQERMQNLNVICTIRGKKHWGRSCYKEYEACFGYGKFGHMI